MTPRDRDVWPVDHDWWPRSLPANVSVGSESWIETAYCFLHCESRVPEGIKVGRRTGVYLGTFFDLGPRGRIEIGDFVTLVGATISTNGPVTIGDYTLVAHEVVIADRFDATPPTSRPHGDVPSPPISIGHTAWIGARAAIIGAITVGDGAIVGAGAVVTSSVPPGAIVAGNPAKIVGWVA